MTRRLVPGMALVSAAALGITLSAAITVSPTSHDFGDAARRGVVPADFTITVSPVTQGAAVGQSITGPDAADFFVEGGTSINPGDPNRCRVGSQGSVCHTFVEFRPQSTSILGPKVATLVLTDGSGTQLTVPLKGKVVAALCQHIVVPCNYAHLYSGTFNWTIGLSGSAASYRESVQVDVRNGVAVCNGSAIDTDQGRTRTGAITGRGLIAVEFLDQYVDSLRAHRLAYRITAACPSPDWPATDDAAATPSRPAELGQGEQSSYDQPATGGIGMNLDGSSSSPNPDADPSNGVTGLIAVRWSLKRS